MVLSLLSTADPCNTVVQVSSSNGCPVFSATTWTRFLLERPFILAPILIVFGAIVTLVGRKFFSMTIAIMGAGLGFGITLLLFQMLTMLDSMSENSESTDGFAFTFSLYLVATITALFIGFILTKMLKIGAAIIGAIAGSFIAVAVYNIVFFWTDDKTLLTVFTVLFSLVFAGLSFRYYERIIIYATAFLGAYSFIRGISLFAGNYPSEIETF